MDSRVSTVYRCKQCSATVKKADQRQAHIHWHGIRDTNVDGYFVAVDEVEGGAADRTPEKTHGRKDGPSPAVLIVSLALLAIMGIVYVMTK